MLPFFGVSKGVLWQYHEATSESSWKGHDLLGVRIARGGELFITDSSELLKVVDGYKGDLPRHMEQRLGLDKGSLGKDPMLGFVYEVGLHNPRAPSSNNLGANKHFVPGGKTSGGLPEGVVDRISIDTKIYMPSDQEGLVEAADIRFFGAEEFRRVKGLARYLMNNMLHSVKE